MSLWRAEQRQGNWAVVRDMDPENTFLDPVELEEEELVSFPAGQSPQEAAARAVAAVLNYFFDQPIKNLELSGGRRRKPRGRPFTDST